VRGKHAFVFAHPIVQLLGKREAPRALSRVLCAMGRMRKERQQGSIALSETGVRVRKVIEARLLAPVGMFCASAAANAGHSVRVESVCAGWHTEKVCSTTKGSASSDGESLGTSSPDLRWRKPFRCVGLVSALPRSAGMVLLFSCRPLVLSLALANLANRLPPIRAPLLRVRKQAVTMNES